MKVQYLSVTETAKLIRAALKRSFPKTKFSVRSQSYAGGASIDVEWTDGPSDRLVEPIVKSYQGGRFDGSIDMAFSVRHWLLADGSAVIASNPGSVGSAGVFPPEREWMPTPDAKLVHFGANHVFTQRRVTRALLSRVVARLEAKGYPVGVLTLNDGYKNAYCTLNTHDPDASRGHDMLRVVHEETVRTHCA